MTVTPVYNATTPDRTIPYITRDQYRASPNVVDTQNLIRGGTQQDNDAALDRIIREASGWCDNCAEQPLTAQLTTESMRAPVSTGPNGPVIRLHPRQHPIVTVNAASFGPDPASLSSLADLSSVWVENQSVTMPLTSTLAGGWTGPLQFGTARVGSRVYVQLTYVAGYAVSTVATQTASNDSTITVKDATGFRPGQQVRLLAGGAPTGTGSNQSSLVQQTVIVQSVNLVSNVLTLTGTVGAVFPVGAAVTAMPDEVEQACIYATTGLLKQRGAGGLVTGGMRAGRPTKNEDAGMEEFAEAEAILALYRPVVP